MRKIKYQGGITKYITSKIGNTNRTAFSTLINNSLKELYIKTVIQQNISIDVVSFSSKKDFNEQVLCILSFVKNLGKPISWTIYTDGSHTSEQLDLLVQTFEFLSIAQIDWDDRTSLPPNTKKELLLYEEYFLHYAKKVALGKRLFYYLNTDIKNPTLFLDSDILFYKKATCINNLLLEQTNGWYLPDADWGCLDSRYKNIHQEQPYQVNGGFFLFNKNLVDMTNGLEFFKSLNFTYEYFSEQTIMHILLKDNQFMPFDPRIFILNSGDQFDFSYKYLPKEMAIRHYTGPVRHKMWQKDYKWHLDIN